MYATPEKPMIRIKGSREKNNFKLNKNTPRKKQFIKSIINDWMGWEKQEMQADLRVWATEAEHRLMVGKSQLEMQRSIMKMTVIRMPKTYPAADGRSPI